MTLRDEILAELIRAFAKNESIPLEQGKAAMLGARVALQAAIQAVGSRSSVAADIRKLLGEVSE